MLQIMEIILIKVNLIWFVPGALRWDSADFFSPAGFKAPNFND